MPPSITARRSPYVFTTAAWFVSLGLFLLGLSEGVHALSRWQRTERVKVEFEQLRGSLERFWEKNGRYPSANFNTLLVQCLLGRADAFGWPLPKEQPWYVSGTTLLLRHHDVRITGNELIDPWGEAYGYLYRPAAPGKKDGYLLVSSGPDRRRSDPAKWGAEGTSDAPEDRDNFVVVVP